MRVRVLLTLVAIIVATLTATGCGRRKAKTAKPPRIGSTESGIASWYGPPYHGRRAANGEVYDMEKMTAAHKTLPFETWVRVRNLTNDKTVDVRIQDRGPFVRGRVIDLSKAAARSIDMLGPGTAKVKLTVIAPPKNVERQAELFAVQAGAYRDKDRAESVAKELRRFGPTRLVERGADPPVWRVLVGEEELEAGAQAIAEKIRSAGHSAFVVRLDTKANGE